MQKEPAMQIYAVDFSDTKVAESHKLLFDCSKARTDLCDTANVLESTPDITDDTSVEGRGT